MKEASSLETEDEPPRFARFIEDRHKMKEAISTFGFQETREQAALFQLLK
jgi:hypothetical protein